MMPRHGSSRKLSVLTGRQFSYDTHWRAIPGRPGGRTPVGDPAAAASRARAKAIADAQPLEPCDTVLPLEECDVEPTTVGTRLFCLALSHRPSSARLLLQAATAAERERWLAVARRCVLSPKISCTPIPLLHVCIVGTACAFKSQRR